MSDWVSQALTGHHQVDGFDSGRLELDRWLIGEAPRAHMAGIAHTTVWTAAGGRVVRAFHAVTPTQFGREELPSRRLAGGYSSVPGYLIARLALDQGLHGHGLGSQLLLDALERIVDAAALAGGRLIAVDAIDEHARCFYLHHDFLPIEGSDRLVMKIATARVVLGLTSSDRRAPRDASVGSARDDTGRREGMGETCSVKRPSQEPPGLMSPPSYDPSEYGAR